MSVNNELYDAANRHQIYLMRFGGSLANDAVALLETAEKDLVTRIAARAVKLGPTAQDAGSKRLQSILSDIRSQTVDLTRALQGRTSTALKELASHEVDLADRRLNEAIGVDLRNFRPSPEVLRALVTKQAVGGHPLSKWFKDLGNARFSRLQTAVQLGVIEGDTMPQIVRRFREAEMVTKRTARTLVRTHVNHVANQSREALYSENSDIIKEIRWTATLDGRTSDICTARDGKTYPLGSGPRPPAHPNCRSTTVPVTKSWDELTKQTLKPGRGTKQFSKLFDKELKAQGFGPTEIANITRRSRASMNGQVPVKETYDSWLRKQPAGFQNDVLGPTKAKLFKDGGLKLDRFVEEPTGRSFTLKEIKAKNQEAWMKAFSEVPKVVVPDTPTEFFNNPWTQGTPEAEWHDVAFDQAPTQIKKLVAATNPRLLPRKGKGAWAQAGNIQMGDYNDPLHRRQYTTWAHEVGHTVDGHLAKGSPDPLSRISGYRSLAMLEDMDIDADSLMDRAGHAGMSAKTSSEARIRREANRRANEDAIQKMNQERLAIDGNEARRAWMDKRLRKLGFTLEDVEDALRLDDGYKNFKMDQNAIQRFIVAIERKDASMIVNEVLDYDRHFHKGTAGHVIDFFGAVTRNEIGYGHSNSYYKRRTARGAEAFANAFAMAAEPNQTWTKVLRVMAPDTMDTFERAIRDG